MKGNDAATGDAVVDKEEGVIVVRRVSDQIHFQ